MTAIADTISPHLLTLLDYDPDTGSLSSKITKSVSTVEINGRSFTNFLGEQYLTYRLIYAVLGIPIKTKVVHHRDNDPCNNLWSNLQLMTRSEHSRHHQLQGDLFHGRKQLLRGSYARRRYRINNYQRRNPAQNILSLTTSQPQK